MDEFDPVAVLRTLVDHQVKFVVIGGIAARLRGAPLVTQDIDVTPLSTSDNLQRVAAALVQLEAGPRTPHDPDGIPVPIDEEFLASASILTLTTRHGDLDLVAQPDGTSGYKDLTKSSSALRIAVDPDLMVEVASLADVIRSKEAAGRDKDRAALPLLRKTLEESER